MAIDKRAGQPAQQSDLINVAQLTAQYYVLKPEVGNAEHAVNSAPLAIAVARRATTSTNRISGHRPAIAEDRAKTDHRSVLCRQRYPPSPSRHLFRCWKC